MERLPLCTQRGGKSKDTREVERATCGKTETLRTGSRASNARRNGDVTDGKLSEQRSTRRRRYGREVERTTQDATGTGRTGKRAKKRATQRNGTVGKNGREMRSERTMLADHSKNSTHQPSRNYRTNLSHTLGRRREATARQSNIVHYGAITTNLTTN